ncbi:MAG: fumarylacetoacetate hydrolase family protein [Bacteroidetes bacterium]|nr:fumarylacetoacetate hydrolase family protein [Bacteroidota bacterium]
MKIICIGRNYVNHAKEMKSEVPVEPVFFMKPDTALLKDNQPFYYPDFSKEIHHELEVVVKISKPGKHIEEKFSHKYYDEITVGIDFTARDLQEICKQKGLPWEKAKAFDGSAPIGKFIRKAELGKLDSIDFSLTKNDSVVQKGNTQDMLFGIDKIIAFVSKFVTLKTGDLIFTGTPEGVAPVVIGDELTAYLNGIKVLNFQIK